jgi:hypothetical protein
LTDSLNHARRRGALLAALMLATFVRSEFVPWLDPCPLQPRAAAVRPDVDFMRSQGRFQLRIAGLPMRSGPPSESGYDCPLYDHDPVDLKILL